MNEADWLQAAADWSSNAITAFTVYVSFTFAYLTCTFLAGARLTRVQALIGSVLYVASATGCIFLCVNGIVLYGEAMKHAGSGIANSFLASADYWLWYGVPLLGGGIVASLYFMWGVRHNVRSETVSAGDV